MGELCIDILTLVDSLPLLELQASLQGKPLESLDSRDEDFKQLSLAIVQPDGIRRMKLNGIAIFPYGRNGLLQESANYHK